MPRTDKSLTFLTGMIIAALYVILLVGFSRESYMRRDAETLSDVLRGASAIDDAANRMCRIDRPACPPLSPWPAGAAAPRAATLADGSPAPR